MNFHIRRVNHNVFDVFEGKQWGTWSRLKGGRNGVYVVNGERLPYSVVKALAANINPTQETQEVSV